MSADVRMSKSKPERSEFIRRSVLPQVKTDPFKIAMINKFFSEDPKDLTRTTNLKKMRYNDKSIDQIMVKVGQDRLTFVKDKVLPVVKDARNAMIIAKMFGISMPTPRSQPAARS
jgi:hypothetical protein